MNPSSQQAVSARLDNAPPDCLLVHQWAFLCLMVTVMAACFNARSVQAAEEVDGELSANIQAPFSGLVTIDGVSTNEGPEIGKGKWTLVMIWATNCHICREQKPKISAFHDAHKDVDARVFGISLDGAGKLAKVKQYMAEYQVTFPTFIGDMMRVMKDYEKLTTEPFGGTPTYLLFSPGGLLKGNNPGPITVSALERFIARHSQ